MDFRRPPKKLIQLRLDPGDVRIIDSENYRSSRQAIPIVMSQDTNPVGARAEFSIGGGIFGNEAVGYAGQAGADLEPFPENRRLLVGNDFSALLPDDFPDSHGEIFQVFLARIYTSPAWVRLLTYPILYPKTGDPGKML